MDLSSIAEHSIAKKTWSTYKTAERMLATFCKQKQMPLQLPVDESTTLSFIHWLAFERNLTAASISGYLAGIKKLHVIRGLEEPKLRTKLVQMVLDGKKNIEAASKLRKGEGRQPVTPDVMALLKAKIREWESEKKNKLTAWAVCTLLFHGAFRGGEILCRSATYFDPAFTLLKQDVTIVQESSGAKVIQVRIKAPKEDKKGTAVIIDVFQTDTEMCPVKAVEKWWKASKHMEQDQPAFRMADGAPLTTSRLNELLKEWLSDTCPGISAHSFRIGAASMMGKLGYSDSDVKAVGRWGSRAFEGYMRLPRTKRRMIAEKLAKYSSRD
jgi:hypothetical protein